MERYGRWTVIESRTVNQRRFFLCQCECGSPPKLVRKDIVTSGQSKSCGCLNREMAVRRNLVHGESTRKGKAKSPEYNSWDCMIQRCTTPTNSQYALYGGRGISVCTRWLESYEAFLEDMGRRPTPKHSIDRIDSNGPYEPSNCRWATKKEQSNNTSRTIRLTIGHETKPLMHWCETLGVTNPSMVRKRIKRGWDPWQALTASSNRPSVASERTT